MCTVFFRRYQPPSSRGEHDWRWWLGVWLPVILAISVIATESTDTFSAQHTSGWLRPVLERLVGAFKDQSWDTFHHYVRKSGHFLGYGTVAFTFLRAWLHTLARQGRESLLSWRLESSILAILSTAVVATCDEIHQTFIPSRTGTPVDVMLDTAGATTLCFLVWLICWSRRTEEPAL